MSERSDTEPVSLDDQVWCVVRELSLRERVYPRLVARGKMKQPVADRELMLMRAVLGTLQAQRILGGHK